MIWLLPLDNHKLSDTMVALMSQCPKCKRFTDYIEGDGSQVKGDLFSVKINCSKNENGCGYLGRAHAVLSFFNAGDSSSEISLTFKKALKRALKLANK